MGTVFPKGSLISWNPILPPCSLHSRLLFSERPTLFLCRHVTRSAGYGLPCVGHTKSCWEGPCHRNVFGTDAKEDFETDLVRFRPSVLLGAELPCSMPPLQERHSPHNFRCPGNPETLELGEFFWEGAGGGGWGGKGGQCRRLETLKGTRGEAMAKPSPCTGT